MVLQMAFNQLFWLCQIVQEVLVNQSCIMQCVQIDDKETVIRMVNELNYSVHLLALLSFLLRPGGHTVTCVTVMFS